MRIGFIVVLFGIWAYLAYGAYQAHDMTKAAIFLGIGIALTAYRVYRFRNTSS